MAAKIIVKMPRYLKRRLQRLSQKTKDALLRTRIQIVLRYEEGYGAQEIARILGCVPATAVRVINRFLEYGEEGLMDGRRENGCPKVDDDLLQALAEMVSKSPEDYGWSRPTWTRELFAKTLEEETGVKVGVSTVSRMLEKVGARWGMARPCCFCPWSKERKDRRIRNILKVVENLPSGDVSYYEDEVDIHLNPRIGRDWMMPSQQKRVPTPGKNKKRYLAGALSVGGTELITVESERKDAEMFINLLEKLRHLNPKARHIHIVLDNSTVHSSRAVQKYLNKHRGQFVFHFLPPYSPEDNKIERVWRELHANVTRNHRCKTMKQLMERVLVWLKQEARKRRRRAEKQIMIQVPIKLAA